MEEMEALDKAFEESWKARAIRAETLLQEIQNQLNVAWVILKDQSLRIANLESRVSKEIEELKMIRWQQQNMGTKKPDLRSCSVQDTEGFFRGTY